MTHKRTVNGSFSRYETPWGCMKDVASQFHAYIRDYQGMILAGMPHGDATGASANCHKFGGKEYLTESGLNELDFGARHMLPQYGMFTSPDPKAADCRHLSPWAYCAGDPVNNTDPTGMSTHVIGKGNGRYEVVGGNLNDNDLGIYVVKPGLGLFTYYVRTGEKIGVTTSMTSFYNSDEEAWAVGNIIDLNDNSGMSFLRDITENTPSLLCYMRNATKGQSYDFKRSNGNYPPINGEDIYRGMPIGVNESGDAVITSARDVGNIAAGYVAGYHGVAWNDARFGFDLYQFITNQSFEGPSTCNAERVGWVWGSSTTTCLGFITRVNGLSRRFPDRMAMYLASDLFNILTHGLRK